MSLTVQSVPRAQPGAEASRLGADFVLLDGSGEVLRGLNATGARVWELIDGRRTAGEIAAEIAREFAAPEPAVIVDVLAFLQVLEGRGLIEGRARTAPSREERAR